MNSNLTGGLALVEGFCSAVGIGLLLQRLSPNTGRISLQVLVDIANIVEATQVLKQGRVSEVLFWVI